MDNAQQTQQQLQEDIQFQVYDLEEIKRNRKEIENVESDVMELGEIFRDLKSMVDEQSENVDFFHTNIMESKNQVIAGHKELQKVCNNTFLSDAYIVEFD